MRVTELSEYPEWLPLISEWLHHEWRGRYGQTLPDSTVAIDRRARLESLRKHMHKGRYPVSFIAHTPVRPIGVVSLVVYQPETTLNPDVWLTNLYVQPAERGRGVAQQLLEQAKGYARSQGEHHLQLFTHDLVDYYQSQGWREERPGNLHGHEGVIMTLSLSDKDRH